MALINRHICFIDEKYPIKIEIIKSINFFKKKIFTFLNDLKY